MPENRFCLERRNGSGVWGVKEKGREILSKYALGVKIQNEIVAAIIVIMTIYKILG